VENSGYKYVWVGEFGEYFDLMYNETNLVGYSMKQVIAEINSQRTFLSDHPKPRWGSISRPISSIHYRQTVQLCRYLCFAKGLFSITLSTFNPKVIKIFKTFRGFSMFSKVVMSPSNDQTHNSG
jgi:hypothetical protein